MNFTHNIKILGLNREVKDGFVFEVKYLITTTSDQYDSEGNIYESYDQINLFLQRPLSEEMIPYESLTEEIVKGWIERDFTSKYPLGDPDYMKSLTFEQNVDPEGKKIVIIKDVDGNVVTPEDIPPFLDENGNQIYTKTRYEEYEEKLAERINADRTPPKTIIDIPWQ